MPIDIEALRAEFPAIEIAGSGTVFFDNPAGTQVARRSLSRMMDAMTRANANLGGFFDTSLRASALVEECRQIAAAFVNARSPDEIVFGSSMTALTFALSRALGRTFKAGDEILLTRMDHDANVAPWLKMAEDHGLTVRWLVFDPATHELDLTALDQIVTPRTRLAAINYASNVLGTINDVATIAVRVAAVGGLTFVDAVQFAPHGVIDVAALGCDFLVCSAYKFYGPHQSLLWGREELLDALPSEKVRPVADRGPGRWEQGTKCREGIAGLAGALEHFAWMGEVFGGATAAASLRERITAGVRTADTYERLLTAQLVGGLLAHGKVRIHGLTAPQLLERRVPTVSFTVEGIDPAPIAQAMAAQGFSVWSGHNYGIEPIRQLGLDESKGVLRVGLAQYNTSEEVGRFLDCLGLILA